VRTKETTKAGTACEHVCLLTPYIEYLMVDKERPRCATQKFSSDISLLHHCIKVQVRGHFVMEARELARIVKKRASSALKRLARLSKAS
jgi:hypothetical protein